MDINAALAHFEHRLEWEIDAADLHANPGAYLIIDARTPEVFAAGHVPGAINLPHRTITAGGIQPNIIPDFGQTWWFVRDSNAPWAKENFDKLVNVARGAALMTGTEMSMEVVASAWPQLGNGVLSEAISRNID